jgi:hypothetical protein
MYVYQFIAVFCVLPEEGLWCMSLSHCTTGRTAVNMNCCENLSVVAKL